MKHRFMLVEEVIENEKKRLLEVGEILIRSKTTGKVYPVKKFNPQNHMKPTDMQMHKYYQDKVGLGPKPPVKKKKVTPKKKKKKVVAKKKKIVAKKKKKLPPKKKKMSPQLKAKIGSQDKQLAKRIVDDIVELLDHAPIDVATKHFLK
ncbi:hypothetical protein HN803_07125, partial [candidate division WWE3 bacterium]|nr:hypothetical protein [candidate division WWE3 bacterium]